MERRQSNALVITIVVMVLFGGFGIFSWAKYQKVSEELSRLRQQQSIPSESVADSALQADDEDRIGGQTDEHDCLVAAGYSWCPSTQKCQRMWEEYCEEHKDQFRGEPQAEGDAGENPPAESEDWNEFEDEASGINFRYPDRYETVRDSYGWPYAVVHLLDKSGGQSYEVTFEVWESEADAQGEGRMGEAIPFFRMAEDPDTGDFISMTCWNPDAAQDCEGIYLTLTLQ